jgi:hypothetical protein
MRAFSVTNLTARLIPAAAKPGETASAKIRFVHLNRTNPALFEDSDEYRAITQAGFRVAQMFEFLPL